MLLAKPFLISQNLPLLGLKMITWVSCFCERLPVQKHALGAGTDMKSEKVKWFQKHMNHDLNWNNDF
jgi:hypothetical protein